MDFAWLVLLSISLCFDTLAVSLSIGVSDKKVSFAQSLKVAAIFAFFQGLLPFIGWLCGSKLEQYISQFDHWVAFGLLFIIGSKMIIDTFKKCETKLIDVNSIKILITMAIATSIDALAVGITLGITGTNILLAVISIALFTFISAIVGVYIGKKAANFCGHKIDIIGGLILIALGVKILIEHLTA